MDNKDTLNLLHECESGVKMGIASIDDVLDKVKNDEFRRALAVSRGTHVDMNERIASMLKARGGTSREPSAMAKGMSWIKTNASFALNSSDSTIADLMTDGCNMGIKSLNKYLNQYPAADSDARKLAQSLISAEEKLAQSIQSYL